MMERSPSPPARTAEESTPRTRGARVEGERLVLRGGKPLSGEVAVRGAKNSTSKLMVAALLSGETSTVRNVAFVEEVDRVADMIRAVDGAVRRTGEDVLEIAADGVQPMRAERLDAFSGKSRIPILFCGSLLARFGEAIVPALGGDRIGPRPVNYHIAALEKLGARVEEQPYGLRLTAKRLAGARIELPYPSVMATEQVLLASVLADGVTELRNAAVEPEIMDLVAVLQNMGAIISVDTDRVITVQGVPRLRGFDHVVMPDRMEAASWACAALATNGDLYVRNARQHDMMMFLNTVRKIGGGYAVDREGIRFWRDRETLAPLALETDVHPGFMTDWQQPFVVVLTQAHGVSVIHETVYENRFGYTEALNAMGAAIQLYTECLGAKRCRFGTRAHRHSAVVVGPTPLAGAHIRIPDLRAGFSYVVAALLADGTTVLDDVRHIHRGYERFVEKLRALGAEVLEADGSGTPHAAGT